MDEYLNKIDWKNITPYLHTCLNNLGESIDWNIHVSLYTDTVEMKMLSGQSVAEFSGNKVKLNKDFRYLLRLKHTITDEKDGFMIFAKKRK